MTAMQKVGAFRPATDTTPSTHIDLNGNWRVRLTDPLQWILERRQGPPRKKSTGYVGRSFCTQRGVLLRDISDYCGEVDPDALQQVEALPERFPYRRHH